MDFGLIFFFRLLSLPLGVYSCTITIPSSSSSTLRNGHICSPRGNELWLAMFLSNMRQAVETEVLKCVFGTCDIAFAHNAVANGNLEDVR